MKGLGPQLPNWTPKELTLFISKELFLDLISLGHIAFPSPNHSKVITTSLHLSYLEILFVPPCQSSTRGHSLPHKGCGS